MELQLNKKQIRQNLAIFHQIQYTFFSSNMRNCILWYVANFSEMLAIWFLKQGEWEINIHNIASNTINFFRQKKYGISCRYFANFPGMLANMVFATKWMGNGYSLDSTSNSKVVFGWMLFQPYPRFIEK